MIISQLLKENYKSVTMELQKLKDTAIEHKEIMSCTE